jgi:hypothetical protein
MTKECETICDLLVDYGDGELAADDDRRVGAHLESCADCRAELRLLQRSLDVARTVWEEAASGAETQVGWAERGESHQDLVEAKLVGLPLLVPPYESLPSHRAGRRWRFAAAALAGAIIIALVTLPWLVPHGGAHVATRLPTGPNRLATGNVSDPAAMSVEEIVTSPARLLRHGCARLRNCWALSPAWKQNANGRSNISSRITATRRPAGNSWPEPPPNQPRSPNHESKHSHRRGTGPHMDDWR